MVRDPDRSKQNIVSAAADLLAVGGLAKLRSTGIAERAGCAKGLINYHFRTRAALLDAVFTNVLERASTPRLAAMGETGIGVVEQTWSVLLRQAQDKTICALAAIHGCRQDPVIDRTVSHLCEALALRWTTATERWLDRSDFTGVDAHEVGAATWAIVDGFGLTLLSQAPELLYPGYLTAWLGLIAGLSGDAA